MTRSTWVLLLTLLGQQALAQQPPICDLDCPAPALPQRPTLVVTAAEMPLDDFGLQDILQKIIVTAGPRSSTTPQALLQSLLDTLATTTLVHPERGQVPVPARPAESAPGAAALLGSGPDGLVPVALFNRFDQMPRDAQHCGEYRVVYARRGAADGKRMFLIFEAALENPDPGQTEACAPVAEFWAGLAGKDAVQLRAALKSFYLQGLDSDSDSVADFKPVIHARHLGLSNGQVRGNLFMAPPWQLREWRLAAGSPLRFRASTINDSPFPDVLGASGIEAGRFRVELLGAVAANLLKPESDAISAECRPNPRAVLNDFAAGISDRFESLHIDAPLVPTLRPPFSAPVQQVLDAYAVNFGQVASAPLTGSHLATRLAVQTCAGCHLTPQDLKISDTVEFPANQGFVHVDERGKLSTALTSTFLPHRMCVLGRALTFAAASAANAARSLQADVPVSTDDGAALELFLEVRSRLDAAQSSNTRAAAPGAAASATDADDSEAESLDQLIERARAAERRLPGAFDVVRRPHG